MEQKQFLLWLLVYLIVPLHAMEQGVMVEEKPQSSDFYYTPEHLVELEKNGIQKALSLYVVIDNEREENILAGRESGALTFGFFRALQVGFFPIIVSDFILLNLLNYQKNWANQLKGKEAELTSAEFSSDVWELYRFGTETASLLIPKKIKKFYEDSFNLSQGKKTNFIHAANDLLPGKDEAANSKFDRLISFLEEQIQITPQAKFDRILTSLFKTIEKDQQSPARWNIILDGHGTRNPPMIAGLDIKNINAVLSILDKQIETSVVYIASCYAGGTNLKLLRFDKEGMQINHNYILIVGSITDAATKNQFTQNFFKSFFNFTATLQDKGKNLNTLLKLLIPKERGKEYVFLQDLYGIPQVWLPGGFGFQSFNVDKEVIALGNVKAKIHEDQKKPIIIENKRVVLLYPPEIKAPLVFKLATPLFPPVISMIHGDSIQFIQQVQLEQPNANASKIVGVMEALVNIFLRMKQIEADKTFLIQRVTGFSDIGHPLIPGFINLSKVIVGPGRRIAFELDDKAWKLKYGGYKILQGFDEKSEIEEIDKAGHEQEFASLLEKVSREEIGQKSISQILKQKRKKR